MIKPRRKAKSASFDRQFDKINVSALKVVEDFRPVQGEIVPEKTFNKVVSAIEKKLGSGIFVPLGVDGTGAASRGIEFVPTGMKSLDWALGGGIARGRIIELFGPEMSGKSSLAYLIIRAFQRQGLLAAYIDAEHATDSHYMRKFGVNISGRSLLFAQPDSGEQALDIAIQLVNHKALKCGVIVIDSVAALVPQKELEQGMDKDTIGLQARMIGKALRKMTAVAAKNGTTVVFINQIRMAVGKFFGNPEDTPGGKALKFFSTTRLDVRRLKAIRKGNRVLGNETRIRVVKNKVAPPFRAIIGQLLYGEGFKGFSKIK